MTPEDHGQGIGLSPAMRSALGSMPIRLRQYVTEGQWGLPFGAPSGGTLKALERRGLIEYDESSHQWRRTVFGESVWGHHYRINVAGAHCHGAIRLSKPPRS
jgi:hypothetical protein